MAGSSSQVEIYDDISFNNSSQHWHCRPVMDDSHSGADDDALHMQSPQKVCVSLNNHEQVIGSSTETMNPVLNSEPTSSIISVITKPEDITTPMVSCNHHEPATIEEVGFFQETHQSLAQLTESLVQTCSLKLQNDGRNSKGVGIENAVSPSPSIPPWHESIMKLESKYEQINSKVDYLVHLVERWNGEIKQKATRVQEEDSNEASLSSSENKNKRQCILSPVEQHRHQIIYEAQGQEILCTEDHLTLGNQSIPPHSATSLPLDVPLAEGSRLFTVNRVERIQDLVYDMFPIGHGGEGRVYQAKLRTNNRPVVIKSYFLDCEQSSRIEYAMMVLCNNLAGVKTPLGLFHSANSSHLLMEDDHKSVSLDVIAERGLLTDEQIQHLFSQMVHILYSLQCRLIKHRDVKLDNFLLNPVTGQLYIIDFGWAMYSALDRVELEEVKRAGEPLMGTFDYLPPESEGPVDTVVSYDKATVYALGCVLLELFFGYMGKVRNIMGTRSVLSVLDELSRQRGKLVSRAAANVIDKCLRVKLEERLSMEQLVMHPWVLADKRAGTPGHPHYRQAKPPLVTSVAQQVCTEGSNNACQSSFRVVSSCSQ